MAFFLTTRGLSHNIEKVISEAKKKIFLITPYLKFSPTLYERLRHTSKKQIAITIIYGKTELTPSEETLLKELKCNIYYKDNLHAKCYANEKSAIICSMNLYSYSEVHNEEMGILIDSISDKKAFLECTKNINIIVESAKPIRLSQSFIKPEAIVENSKNDYNSLWLRWLKKRYPKAQFEKNGWQISAKNLPEEGFEYSNSYGFATITFIVETKNPNKLRETYNDDFQKKLSPYRLYWTSPNQIRLYEAKDSTFKNDKERVEYFASGFSILLLCLKKAKLL